GNTVVFRIGSDALGTAGAIITHAVEPSLAASGLPAGAVRLLDSPSRATGWALFSDPRLALAVARGSGEAVDQLGAVARQAGLAVSLHGTGGAWIVATENADADRFASVAYHSLDRKVCNTLNVCCITAGAAPTLVPVLLDVLERAAHRRSSNPKLHVTKAAEHYVPSQWFTTTLPITRAGGPVEETQAELLREELLGREWEWEESPELTLHVVADVAAAIDAFNTYSPRLVASLISTDADEQEQFWSEVDAPFVGDGFTRWVDGQFALDRPELGLSNWEHGRLFGRSAVLSGDSVYTVRTRVRQSDADLHR
ncbi:MAG: aldehyde dehydrogenase family protein, partial [Acidimicrobiia bacterium]